jgi:hypothetical protein
MGKVDAPAERGYMNEMQSALEGQMGIQGQLLSAEKQYTPEWQAVQKQALMGGMGTLASIYGQTSDQSMALQRQNLQGQGDLYGQVGGYARNAYNATLDPTTAGLYNSMASQASQGMANGRNLSDQETQMAQQSARAAMAARGMQSSNQAIASEVLNSYGLANAREDRARNYAGQVYGVGQNNAAQAMQMYGTPLMNQMNQFSTPTMLGQSQQLYGSIGAKLFQPESQYNSEIISANQQNQMQASMANAQAQAGMISAGIGALGAMGGGFLGNPGLFGGTPAGGGAGAGSGWSVATAGNGKTMASNLMPSNLWKSAPSFNMTTGLGGGNASAGLSSAYMPSTLWNK